MNKFFNLMSIIDGIHKRKSNDKEKKRFFYNSQAPGNYSNPTIAKASSRKKVTTIIVIVLLIAGSIMIIYGILLMNNTLWMPAAFMSINGSRTIPAGGVLPVSTYPLSLEHYLNPHPHINRVIANWNITYDPSLKESSNWPIFAVIGVPNGTKLPLGDVPNGTTVIPIILPSGGNYIIYGLPNGVNWTSVVLNHNSSFLIASSNNIIGNFNGYYIGFTKMTFNIPSKDEDLGFIWINPSQSPIVFNYGNLTLEYPYHPYYQTGLDYIMIGIVLIALIVIVYAISSSI